MFSSAQGTSEVEVIQLKRLFSATMSRLNTTESSTSLISMIWTNVKNSIHCTCSPTGKGARGSTMTWKFKAFSSKNLWSRDSQALMLLKPSTFLSIYIETIIYVYFMLFADLNLSRSFSTFALSKDWKAMDCPWPATSKESILGLYWRNFIIIVTS